GPALTFESTRGERETSGGNQGQHRSGGARPGPAEDHPPGRGRGLRTERVPRLPHRRRGARGRRRLRARLPLLQEQGGAAPARLRGRVGRLHVPNPRRGRGQRTAGAEDPPHRPGRLRGIPHRPPRRARAGAGVRPEPEHRRGEPADRVRRGARCHHPDVRAGPGAGRAPRGAGTGAVRGDAVWLGGDEPHRVRDGAARSARVRPAGPGAGAAHLPVPGRRPCRSGGREMEEGPVRSQVEAGQALLTIDRPAARNALSPEVVQALRAALARAGSDPAVRVVVLTGAGDRVFSAGGDLGALPEGGYLAGHALRREYGALLEALAGSPLPTIARVNGHALGGGLGLVLACDLAVAVDSAELGTPEIDVGLFPMMVLAWLQRHLGRKRALELVLTGDRLKAEEALRWGLLNRVVPRGELDDATRAL